MLRHISMMFFATVLLVGPSTANAGKFSKLEQYLYEPFSATMINQETIMSREELKAYFEKWVSGEGALIKSITMALEADELTTIYDGKYGIARGSNMESYELTTGKPYDLASRWTATLIKDGGQWKVLAVHSGVNFIDNPVFAAAEESLILFAAGGVATGIMGTLILCWLFRRRRPA